MACGRLAPSLLLHVNILLTGNQPANSFTMFLLVNSSSVTPLLLLVSNATHRQAASLPLFSGAGLATGARLKWDPSTYLLLRELFPREYRTAAVALTVAAVALLLLAHCAGLALRTRRAALRRTLLLVYAFLMALMMCGEAALVWWLAARIVVWSRALPAEDLQHVMQLREHLLPLLEHLAHWHPLPAKIKSLVQEAEADAPRNLYVALAAAALLVLLQTAAVVLAVLLATCVTRARPSDRTTRRPRTLWREQSTASTPLSSTSRSEKNKPRVVYRNGRLMVCDGTTTPHSA